MRNKTKPQTAPNRLGGFEDLNNEIRSGRRKPLLLESELPDIHVQTAPPPTKFDRNEGVNRCQGTEVFVPPGFAMK